MRGMLRKAREATAALWPDVRAAFAWVHEAAEILENRANETGEAVRKHYEALLERMRAQAAAAGGLQGAIKHFLTVTASYWPGLFHCYDVPGLPRTNNDLEQFFGAIRHRERRCTGRKRASSNLVVRGAVRIIAATVTSICPPTPEQLAPRDLNAWRTQRHRLKRCQHARVLQCRFRRQPDAYLASLEERLVKLSLPP
jgi:hypothetical protein